MFKSNVPLIIGALLVCFAMAAGCGGSSSTPSDDRTAAEREASTQNVSPSSGGTISFPDGAKVSFPAGSVSAETAVFVTKPKNASALETGFAGYMRITPESLALSGAATVTLKYDTAKIADASKIHVLSYSESNPEINAGGEISYFQFITPEAIDTAAGTVTFNTSHFSVFSYFWEDPAYLVLGLPGKYLKKGDLIYVLTNAQSSKTDGAWFPGHGGLYLGTTDPNATSNDGTTIVESTPKDATVEILKDGVQTSPLDKFKTLSGTHIFIGARRPKSTAMTAAQRSAIATYALGKVDKIGYRDVGGGSFLNLSDSSKISCVALTELAYSAAGINLVPEICEVLLYPIRQFNRTAPVDEITVQAGETIDFLVYGLVRGGLRYSKEDKNYSMTATSTSDVFTTGGAKFSKYVDCYDFNWKPTKEAIGKSYVISFALSGSGFSSITQSLTINVTGSYFPMVDGSKYQYADTQTTTNSSGTTTQTNSIARTITAGTSNEITDVYTHGKSSATFVTTVSDTGGYWIYNKAVAEGSSTVNFSPYWKIMPNDLKDPKTSWSNDFQMIVPSSEGTDGQTLSLKETDVVGDDYETITVNGIKFENALKITRAQTGTMPDYHGKDSEGKPVTIRTDSYATSSVEYYAPGVGLIKGNSERKIKQTLIQSDGSTKTASETSSTVREIVSYTIP